MRPLCLGSHLNTNSLSLQHPEISIPASSHFIILPPVIALQLYPCWYLCGHNPCWPNKMNAQAKLVPFVRYQMSSGIRTEWSFIKYHRKIIRTQVSTHSQKTESKGNYLSNCNTCLLFFKLHYKCLFIFAMSHSFCVGVVQSVSLPFWEEEMNTWTNLWHL